MMFGAPLFLLGLLPWGVITAWLLWGRRLKQPVPFLPLWEGAVGRQRTRRSVQTPPLALAAALLAMLLAVAAAARPIVRAGRGGKGTVLVDRGVTMSATSGGRARFAMAAESLARGLRQDGGAGSVDVVDLVNGQRRKANFDGWERLVLAMPRTAMRVAPSRAAVMSELAAGGGAVILLSDVPVEVKDSRFSQVFPAEGVRNVGIVALAARELPSPQVMVKVRGDGPMELRVSSGGHQISEKFTMDLAGGAREIFVDVPAFGDRIEARLVAVDDLDADNVAWLVRKGRSPRIEIRSQIPDALRRMLEIYSKARPPQPQSPVLMVVNRLADLPFGDAGVVDETPVGGAPASGTPRVTTDPIPALVDWAQVTRGATVAPAPPTGWTPLVTIGDRMVVARRETPARQVWVGFESPQWPRSADFVVFWTNVMNWVGGGGGGGNDFVGHPVSIVPEYWKRQGDAPADVQPSAWPGVFQRGDGSLLAMNALDVRFPPPPRAANPPARLDADTGSYREIAPWVSVAAMALVCVAALSWRRNRPSHQLAGTYFADNAS